MKNGWWRIAVVVALVIVVSTIIAGKNKHSASAPDSARTAVSSSADRTSETPANRESAATAVEPTTQRAQTGADTTKLPKLVDLGATKCIPCKMMAPILEELAKDFKGQLEVQFIDVWENSGAGAKHGIKTIPTQVFYDANGKEFFRHEGFFAREDILAKFKEQGIKLAE